MSEETKKNFYHKGKKPEGRKPIRNDATKKISHLNEDSLLHLSKNDSKKHYNQIENINQLVNAYKENSLFTLIDECMLQLYDIKLSKALKLIKNEKLLTKLNF